MPETAGLRIFMAISECPSCTFHIALEAGLEVGDAIKCPDCGARLKLTRIFPPVFEIADKEE
jgi:lysine biosynthesis protein LysW